MTDQTDTPGDFTIVTTDGQVWKFQAWVKQLDGAVFVQYVDEPDLSRAIVDAQRAMSRGRKAGMSFDTMQSMLEDAFNDPADTDTDTLQCEGGCGPATHEDSDGVPLCEDCYDALPMFGKPGRVNYTGTDTEVGIDRANGPDRSVERYMCKSCGSNLDISMDGTYAICTNTAGPDNPGGCGWQGAIGYDGELEP